MTLKPVALSIRDDTKWPLYKWFQRGVLDFPVKAKDGRPKCPSAGSWNLFDSAQVQSTAFVNWHSECSQEKRRKKKQKQPAKQKKPEQCVSKFRTNTKSNFSGFPVCFIQSVTPSLRARSEHFVRDVRCSGLNIYDRCQMGWVSREPGERGGGGLGLWKIIQQPPPANSKLLKTILTYCAVEGHCQISFRVSPATCWMLLLKKALQ